MAQMLLTFSQSHGCIGDRLDVASGDTAGLSPIGDAGQANDKYDISRIVACGLDRTSWFMKCRGWSKGYESRPEEEGLKSPVALRHREPACRTVVTSVTYCKYVSYKFVAISVATFLSLWLKFRELSCLSIVLIINMLQNLIKSFMVTARKLFTF